jgi:hypothetical protein
VFISLHEGWSALPAAVFTSLHVACDIIETLDVAGSALQATAAANWSAGMGACIEEGASNTVAHRRSGSACGELLLQQHQPSRLVLECSTPPLSAELPDVHVLWLGL